MNFTFSGQGKVPRGRNDASKHYKSKVDQSLGFFWKSSVWTDEGNARGNQEVFVEFLPIAGGPVREPLLCVQNMGTGLPNAIRRKIFMIRHQIRAALLSPATRKT